MRKLALTFFVPAAIVLGIYACKPSSQATTGTQRNEPVTVVRRDTVRIAPPRYPAVPQRYNPTYTRRNDLLHTKLDVRFDWAKQYLYGKAELKFKPLFYNTDSLELDAKGFDLKTVALREGSKDTPLKYNYDGRKIKIQLPRQYSRREEYLIFIEYTAKPNELALGGSAAITSDKGLYFINPMGEEPDKPRQIWTQGETEASSCWFPTIDKPNERTTQELSMTVEDNFKTLSNGLLKSSVKNADGTRTDTWVMDKPHAPYLFMMTVGEFAVVEDSWNGMPVYYYVEPKFEPFAKQIYNHTPEMLTFFSDILGVKYPWPKMAHVIVRDYVSGAMENTSAVIYGEFCQKTDKELEDANNDGIVAHETFHHWFGDLVTCESWANLPLNESFANYSEYLWYEHKYGRDEADRHLLGDMSGYFAQAKNNVHDLIHFGYTDKEDMFDAHSYNKGGAILHMLRNYLGDEAFFASLKLYLERNAYSAAEAHQLRLAFEEVSGEDLNWFFNQWFYSSGHPDLKFTYATNARAGKAYVFVEQRQDLNKAPLFKLPLKVDVYYGEKPTRYRVFTEGQRDTLEFPIINGAVPKLINVDADRDLLADIVDDKTNEQLVFQFYHAGRYLDRSEALDRLRYAQGTDEAARGIYLDAFRDPFWGIRTLAIDNFEIRDNSTEDLNLIGNLAKSDKDSRVRAAAWTKLGKAQTTAFTKQAVEAFDTEKSYTVIAAALDYLYNADPAAALQYAGKLSKIENENIIVTVGELYANSKDPKYLEFFESSFSRLTSYALLNFFALYGQLLAYAPDAKADEGVQLLYRFATTKGYSQWGKFGATNAINTLRRGYLEQANSAEGDDKDRLTRRAADLKERIRQIKEQEADPMLKRFYNNF